MGVTVLLPLQVETEGRDLDKYDAYIDSIGLIYHDGERGGPAENQSVQLRPVRQDTGLNPNETRPESGDIFGQGDFSNGQDQQFYHHRGSDPARYLSGEGNDIEISGKLRHVRAVSAVSGVTAPRALESVGDALYVIDGTNVKRTTNLASFTTENPHGPDTPVEVRDVTGVGSELFLALGVNGVHKRATTGTFSHYQSGGVDLNVGDARRVFWLRSRLFVVGDGGRKLYVVTDAASVELEILPAGWEFEKVAEAGAYVYATAVNVAGRQSRIHYFGLDNTGTLEPKGGFDLPVNQLARSVRGFLGRLLIGVGKRNDEAGHDPVVYQAGIDGDGAPFLETKVAEGKAGTLDLGVRSIEAIGESLLCGWSLSAESPFGAREGLGEIYPARGAFAHSYSSATVPATPEAVLDMTVFNGRVVYITSDQMMVEDPTVYRPTMEVITSIADWSSTGLKSWDRVEVSHKGLPAGATVELYYTLKHPEEGEWNLAGTNAVPGSERASFPIPPDSDEPALSSQFALKLVSNAVDGGQEAPEIHTVSARSYSVVEEGDAEWILIRHIRVLHEDQKTKDAAIARNRDPNAAAARLEDLLHQGVIFYEQQATYKARVEAIKTVKVTEPDYDTTQGESAKNAYYIQMALRGTKVGKAGTGAIHLA